MGLILITHDISVVQEVTDQVAVMYAGRIVERGLTHEVLNQPGHPYTLGLKASVAGEELKGLRLLAIPGTPPDCCTCRKDVPSPIDARLSLINALSECPLWKSSRKGEKVLASIPEGS